MNDLKRKPESVAEHEAEYFVNHEPLYGEMVCYGPFNDLFEARDCFERTYPEFDGGSVTLTKIESDIPGISPNQLRKNALREEYETHESRWGIALSRSTTLLGRDVWGVSQDQAGLIYTHKGKRYEPGFERLTPSKSIKESVSVDKPSCKTEIDRIRI